MLEGKKLIVLNAGHGGKDRGAVTGQHDEAAIVRSIVLKLQNKLLADGKLAVKTSHELAEKPLDCDWPENERIEALNALSKSGRTIDFLLSLHIGFANFESRSGLVVYHGGTLKAPVMMHDSLIARASEGGYDLTGGFSVKEQFDRQFCGPCYSPEKKPGRLSMYGLLDTSLDEIALLPGFLSNPTDREMLTNKHGQTMIAEGMANGLYRILGINTE